MNRRLMTILLPLATASLAAGCSTFSDNDAVARVGDVELSSAELREQADAQGAPQNEALDANIVRQQIAIWVGEQITAAGDATVAADAYASGLEASGSICVEVIVVETADEAGEALTELESGTAFADVFAARNIDPSLDAGVGRIGCLVASQLPFDSGNPFVDSLLDLDAAHPLASIELPGEVTVHAVVRFIPYDELGPDETPTVIENLTADALGVDIHIDPRYGTYDSATGTVVGLG